MVAGEPFWCSVSALLARLRKRTRTVDSESDLTMFAIDPHRVRRGMGQQRAKRLQVLGSVRWLQYLLQIQGGLKSPQAHSHRGSAIGVSGK